MNPINTSPIRDGVYQRLDVEVKFSPDLSECTITQGGQTVNVGSAAFFRDVVTVLERVVHETGGLEDVERVRLYNSIGTKLALPNNK